MATRLAERSRWSCRFLGTIAIFAVLDTAALADTVALTAPGTQTWAVPAGVTSISIVAVGGGGGGGWGAAGGYGGKVTSTLSVSPGQTFSITIGGGGGGSASEGGGGAGATSVDPGSAQQIIAGGGGGGGGGVGGNGNGSNGADGASAPGTGGRGGSAGIGGAGGVSIGRPTCTTAVAGGDGNGGPGGLGGSDTSAVAGGAAGSGLGSGAGGAAAHYVGFCAPGGGGGGYGGGGGGGGAGSDGGGGGGGSVGPAGSVISIGTNRGALRSAGGNGSVTITYSLANLRTLSQAIDASVQRTIAAQVSSAVRFTETQIRNVTDHINQLGDGFSLSGNHLALGFNSLQPTAASQATQFLLAAADAQLTPAGLSSMSDADPTRYAGLDESENTSAKGAGSTYRARHLAHDEDGANSPRYAFWAAGDLLKGRMNVGSGTNTFTTDGITLGLDFLLSQKAIFGVALGYGRDHTDIDTLGTRVKGAQRSLTAYSVYEPHGGILVDGLLGVGDLAMNNNRYSAMSSAVLQSDRKGLSKYAAIGMSFPTVIDAFSATPYIRASYLDIRLNSYNEGADANALAFARTTVKSSSIFAGVTASYDIYTQDGGKWVPSVKLELRRNTRGSVDQSISFADTPNDSAILSINSTPQNVQTFGLGVRYFQKRGVSLGLTWLGSIGSNAYRASAVKADLVIPF